MPPIGAPCLDKDGARSGIFSLYLWVQCMNAALPVFILHNSLLSNVLPPAHFTDSPLTCFERALLLEKMVHLSILFGSF